MLETYNNHAITHEPRQLSLATIAHAAGGVLIRAAHMLLAPYSEHSEISVANASVDRRTSDDNPIGMEMPDSWGSTRRT